MKLLNRPREIDEDDIVDLHGRGVVESRILDYKEELEANTHDEKIELLKDVSAMANAEGGLLIYGVRQDTSGAPASLPGVSISDPDALQNHIDLILNDNLDPPISGIVQRAVPRGDGTYFYVIRVPTSSVAPHMITARTKRPRFYLRINTVNVPMTAAQIREVVLRHGLGEQRALDFVRDRLAKNMRHDGPWCCCNIVPLYREAYSLDITDSEVTKRLTELGIVGGNMSHSAHGYYVAYERPGHREHVLFSRDGAVELFLAGAALFTEHNDIMTLAGRELEQRVLGFLRTLATAEISGLPEPPILLHLHLQGTDRTGIFGSNGLPTRRLCKEPQIAPEHMVAYEWGDTVERFAKLSFDVLWQAYGEARSPYYDSEGKRLDG